MMDCKKALTEAEGDVEKAVELLRKKGLAKAAKRSDRSTNAGVVAVYEEGAGLAMLELNCETDFVAKNDDFNEIANTLARQVAADNPADVDTFSALPYAGDTSKTVGDVIAEALAKIGESIKIGRFTFMKPATDPGKVVHYIHTGASIGVAIDFAAGKAETLDADGFTQMAHDVALHVTAAAPQYLDPDSVPAEVVEKEKEIYKAEAEAAGKPEKILEKIAEGKLNKFYKDNCLVKQDFVKDNDLTIEKLIAQVAGEIGDTISVKSFVRYKVDEG
jgi:elongation factor Ts